MERSRVFESGQAVTIEISADESYPTQIDEVRNEYLVIGTPMKQREYIDLPAGQKILLAVTRPRHEVFSQLYDFASLPAPPEPSLKNTRVVFTPQFQLSGKNLEIEGYSQVTNSWVYVVGDVGNEVTGLIESFELPIEYYEGYDDGKWTEGSRAKKTYLSALSAGTYAMRLEAQWDEKSTPPPVMITVKEGVFRWTHFILALIVVTVPAIFLGFRKAKFESARWADAGFTASGTEKDTSDDDEE